MESLEASPAYEALSQHVQSMLPAEDGHLGSSCRHNCCLHSTEDYSLLDEKKGCWKVCSH